MKQDSPSEVTIKEAAFILGVSQRTIFNYLRSGKIKDSRKDGKKILIPSAEIERLKNPEGAFMAEPFDHERQVIIEKEHYEKLLHESRELAFRIGQLEAEKRFMAEEAQKSRRLLEDMREKEKRLGEAEEEVKRKDEELESVQRKAQSLQKEIRRMQKAPWWKRLFGAW